MCTKKQAVTTLICFLTCILFHTSLAKFSTTATATSTIIPFTNETDRLALLAIKSEIQGDPFQFLSSWNDSLHFCNWPGIACGQRHQRVTVLQLVSLNLQGTLSPYIGKLEFLRVINLTGNSFRGNIPPEVGGLFRLRTLVLNNNLFEGVIPGDIFNCSELRSIQLSRNNLTGDIPAEIGSLPKLVVLSLASNQLSGIIPPSVGNLTTLTDLYLGYNFLEGSIPLELGHLSNLQVLDFGFNNLSGVFPDSLFNKSSLMSINMSSNSLYGQLLPNFGLNVPKLQDLRIEGNQFFGTIPSTLANASRLRNIDISFNSFIGPLPQNLGALQDLQTLQLQYNQFGTENSTDDMGFISSLTNCTQLRIFFALDCGLKGAFPTTITNLSTKLAFLGLRENYVYGNIPEGISNLVGLVYLGLSANNITGNIPDSIGKLSQLQALYLDRNQLSGSIPYSVGGLSDISDLILWQNSLEGTIPASLSNCSGLRNLDLSLNNLIGTIPEQVLIGSSLALNGLYLSDNQFSGPLPMQLGNLKALTSFYIDGNRFSGEIPSALGDCLTLDLVQMSGNLFEGSIPSSFANLINIQILDLSSNNLSGQFPGYLSNLEYLLYVNLSFNSFYGEVPTNGVFSSTQNLSVLGNPKLCGGIRQLQLPPCPAAAPAPAPAPEKHRKHNAPRIVIFIVCAIASAFLLSACIFFFFYWRRHPKQVHASTLQLHVEFTYAELHQATDGFSLANLIGEGSFGSVYRGLLPTEDKIVAVKVFHLQERGANKSFLSECEALKNIRHRNLVKIISSCSSIDFKGNDFKALIYEFMPNGSLEAWLHPNALEIEESKRLNLVQRLNIAIDVAAALDYLHHHCHTPIVHCDLKPSNILLDNDLTAHVGDFGLARLVLASAITTSHSQASSSGLNGTIGYAAPEYGFGTKPSTQGDMYSYGILLLELFTGKRPTDSMFTGGLSLHGYVRMALPNQAMQVIEPQLSSLEAEGESSNGTTRSAVRSNIHQIDHCLASILRIGVLCSAELPGDRMDIQDALKEFHVIKKTFLNTGAASQNKIG